MIKYIRVLNLLVKMLLYIYGNIIIDYKLFYIKLKNILI